MAQQRPTQQQLVQLVEADRATLAALLREAGPERLNEPGVLGDWTLKDVVAHLTGWRLRTIARLEAAARGAEPVMPWPAELDVADADDNEAIEPINQWLYAQNRERSAAEIIGASDESFRKLAAAIGALRDAALLTPGHFTYGWLGGAAIGPALVAGSIDHLDHLHEEHEPGLRAWLMRPSSV